MQDVLIVHSHDSKDDLGHVSQDITCLESLLHCYLPLNCLGKVASLSVLHHDINTIVFTE